MRPSYKKTRRTRDRKRNKPKRSPHARRRRRPKRVRSKKRLSRQRRPETLQRFWRDKVQPWLDFVNLPDDPECLCRDFLHQFSVRYPVTRLQQLAARMTRFGTRAEPNEDVGLSELHRKICDVLDEIPTMTRPTPEEENRKPYEEVSDPLWMKHWGQAEFDLRFCVRDFGDGRVFFDPDPIEGDFKQALQGAEIRRIRRCPVCEKFFYAERKNTGACKEHLALARVRRSRNPALRKKYERNRSINRLTKSIDPLTKKRVSIGKAMRQIAKQPQERSA